MSHQGTLHLFEPEAWSCSTQSILSFHPKKLISSPSTQRTWLQKSTSPLIFQYRKWVANHFTKGQEIWSAHFCLSDFHLTRPVLHWHRSNCFSMTNRGQRLASLHFSSMCYYIWFSVSIVMVSTPRLSLLLILEYGCKNTQTNKQTLSW